MINDSALKKINKLKKIGYMLKTMVSGLSFWIVAGILFLYACFGVVTTKNEKGEEVVITIYSSISKAWYSAIDHSSIVISFGTLLFVLILWFLRLYKDWEDSLPNYVSAKFTHYGRSYFETRYYYISGKNSSDIRQLPQTVAKTYVNNGDLLPLSHFVEVLSTEVNTHDKINNNKPFRHISITMELDKLNMKKHGKGIDLSNHQGEAFIINSYEPKKYPQPKEKENKDTENDNN